MNSDKSTKAAKAAKPEPAPQITPMPFPGESPTVSLAMAAGRMYGLQPEEEKPAKPKRRTKAKAAGKKAASKPTRSAAKPKARAKRAKAKSR